MIGLVGRVGNSERDGVFGVLVGMGNSDLGGALGVLVGIGNSERGGTFGVLVVKSERGGTLGVLIGTLDEGGFTVEVLKVTVDFTVVVANVLSKDFFVVEGCCVVVVVSLSFDLPPKNPVIPLKNPFFLVVVSGVSVVVVGLVTGGCKL